jgi:HEAT repeat protein
VLDVDPTVSGTAVRILGFLRGNARAAVGALTLALERDTSLDFRKSVIHALSEIGPEAAPAVPALVRILRQGPDDHREAVLQALCSIGEPARIAAPAVLEALERGSTDVRAQAAAAVAGLCLGPEEALPSLLSALESPDDLVRAAAARALCVMGDDGISALPFIAEHLADPSPVVQVWAAAAIARGSREELDQHLPRLIAAVGAGEEEVWHAAVGSLGEIGAPARRAIPLLIHHLLAKPRWPVAMESVSKIGIDTEHLDAVLTLLRQRPEYIWVLFAGQNQQAMFPLLLDLLEQGNLEMRRYAGMFLGHQGPVPPSLVPRLRALITAPDSDVRQGAWRALQATLGRGFFLRDPGWRAWLEQPN